MYKHMGVQHIPFVFGLEFRDWSLITGRGGYKTGGGGACFTPTKRGGGKSFSHAEGGGHDKFWGSFYAVA